MWADYQILCHVSDCMSWGNEYCAVRRGGMTLVLGTRLENGFELVLSEDNGLVAIVAYFGLLQGLGGFTTWALSQKAR